MEGGSDQVLWPAGSVLQPPPAARPLLTIKSVSPGLVAHHSCTLAAIARSRAPGRVPRAVLAPWNP
eukprot:3100101-Rhodomonas_salina.1